MAQTCLSKTLVCLGCCMRRWTSAAGRLALTDVSPSGAGCSVQSEWKSVSRHSVIGPLCQISVLGRGRRWRRFPACAGLGEDAVVNRSLWDLLKPCGETVVRPCLPRGMRWIARGWRALRLERAPTLGSAQDSAQLWRRASWLLAPWPPGATTRCLAPQEDAQARFWACDTGKKDFAASFLLAAGPAMLRRPSACASGALPQLLPQLLMPPTPAPWSVSWQVDQWKASGDIELFQLRAPGQRPASHLEWQHSQRRPWTRSRAC